MAFKDGKKVPNSLYTTEGTLSRKKVEDELKVPDPTPERAEAAFQKGKEEDEADNSEK